MESLKLVMIWSNKVETGGEYYMHNILLSLKQNSIQFDSICSLRFRSFFKYFILSRSKPPSSLVVLAESRNTRDLLPLALLKIFGSINLIIV